MGTVRHKLMLQESEKRLASAQLLRSSQDDSDSAYLLELLAFELYLKLVMERATQSTAPFHHHYDKIFDSLPRNTQDEILRLAGERIGPSALSNNHLGVLRDLSSNFVGLRYPYEKYSKISEQEYAAIGANWIASGARTSEADYRYHPEELFGLAFALRQLANGC
ncbi:MULTISPECIES: hypothetical protein [Lysobacter]|uniref:hypothetical protein n=1 Tax=Lysobacter TaxID=68 RepID=UPI001F42B1CF|nr:MULTISPECIES: hypothetical protein [Lysobacter]UJB19193.1 hypothetical protein L1A79_23255 [Lysobacter capsici]UJQ27082.1 hypothetical protein L2D09_16630 [Lysobacter gummosus]